MVTWRYIIWQECRVRGVLISILLARVLKQELRVIRFATPQIEFHPTPRKLQI